MIGKGVKFERIRRITGYLVGTLERFNDAKRAEERERVKHMAAPVWPDGGRGDAFPDITARDAAEE